MNKSHFNKNILSDSSLFLRISFFFFSFFLFASIEAKTKHVLILHTSDTHSCIYPLNENLSDTMQAGRGGFLRRIVMLKEERAKDKNLLLFDSGDFSQGSPYYTLFKGDVEIQLMNSMCYDAATVGNHEFDYGLDNMARIFREAEFPIVCSNYDFTGTPVEGLVKPYIILERYGMNIGVIGICPEMKGLVDIRKCVGVKYLDPKIVADSMATMLKEQKKCDMVICLSHLGWNVGGDDDNAMIARSHNIDVVLGGHSHTYLKELKYVKNALGVEIPVDHNGKNAIFVGKITLNYSK